MHGDRDLTSFGPWMEVLDADEDEDDSFCEAGSGEQES